MMAGFVQQGSNEKKLRLGNTFLMVEHLKRKGTYRVATMSTGPPLQVATMGTPCAAASISVSPNGSCGTVCDQAVHGCSTCVHWQYMVAVHRQ